MPGKRKATRSTPKRTTRRVPQKPEDIYPSLREGPTPAERLAALLAKARKRGLRPWTEEEFDRMLEGPSDWPEDENLDDFLAWLRRLRREGKP